MCTFFLILSIILIVGILMATAEAYNKDNWIFNIVMTLLFVGIFLASVVSLVIPGRYASTKTSYQLIKTDNSFVEQTSENYIVHYQKNNIPTTEIIPIASTTIVFNNTKTPSIECIFWQVDWSKVRNYWSWHLNCPDNHYYIYIPRSGF